jgi:hypothetical protein
MNEGRDDTTRIEKIFRRIRAMMFSLVYVDSCDPRAEFLARVLRQARECAAAFLSALLVFPT